MKTEKQKKITALKRLKIIAVFCMVVSVIMLAAYSKEVSFLYGILDWKDNQYPLSEQEEVEQQNYNIEPMPEEITIFNEVDSQFSDKRKLKIARGLFWFIYAIWNFMNIEFIISIKEDELKKGFFEEVIEKGQRKYGGFKDKK